MKYTFIISLLVLLVACNNSATNKQPITINQNSPDSIVKTTYDTIYTKEMDNNEKLLVHLKTQLAKENFTFEERKSRGGLSYGITDTVVLIKGNGIREYYARSTKPQKGTTDFYPDFNIWVYEFPTNQTAQENFNIIEKANKSHHREIRMISVEKIIINGNEIFHLSTRTEMFLPFIEKYGEMIKNYR